MSSGKAGGQWGSKEDALVAGSPPGEDDTGTENEHVPCMLRYITLISRLFGVITLTVLWSFTVMTLNDLHKYNGIAPWYLLVISILASFFEMIWLINKCVVCRVGLKESQYDDSMSLAYDEIDHSRNNHCCCKFWRFILWIDNWRKALLYIVFGVPMFIRELVTVYTVICGVILLILAALYFMKSFKESKCVARRPRKHSFVQTTGTPKPKYVEHPVQTQIGDYPPASHGYDSIGHTNNIQPPEYSDRGSKPSSESKGTNYFRPFKDGMGNVKDDSKESSPKSPKRVREKVVNPEEKRKSTKTKVPAADAKQTSGSEGSKEKPESSKDASKGKSSPRSKSPTDEKGFKLFGLLKKDDKPKEQVVTMVSSERSHDEDLEHYPDGKNPFGDDEDCEWDPNNRGDH